MMSLLVLKERLREFYSKCDIYITPVMKFLFSYLAFYMMNRNIGFMTRLREPLIPLVLALVCSFLPYGAISFISALFMLAHLSGISLELTMVMAVVFAVAGLLYYGFQPGDSYLLVLTPMFFVLKIPYAIPLIVGLAGSVFSVIPISCGVFVYYALLYVKQNAGVLTNNDMSVDSVQKVMQLMNSLLSNKLMLVMIAAFALALITVVITSNLSMDYSWVIAIVLGTIVQVGTIFIGDITVDAAVPVIQLLIGLVVSILLAAIYIFFVFAVDYSRTEYVQFEDDDYYYYVKAVPKLTISTPDVKVQKINAREVQRPRR